MIPQAVKVILAEDDDGHAALVELNLERAGLAHSIIRVRNGQELLDLLHGRGANAVADVQAVVLILDLNMPLVSGMEVLRQLKACPRLATIPIIVLTTTDDSAEINRCYELGCSVYLSKPIDYDKFIEAIRRLGLFLQLVKIPNLAAAPV